MIRVKKATYVSEYKLLLTFDNGKQKIVDIKKVLRDFEGPVFQPLKDIECFKKFEVNKDKRTVVWPNEIDLCPDVLYEMGIDVKDSVKKTSRKKAVKSSSVSKARIAAKSKH